MTRKGFFGVEPNARRAKWGTEAISRCRHVVALAFAWAAVVSAPTPAYAVQTAVWNAPLGTLGWCSPIGSGIDMECFADPLSACKRAHSAYNPTKIFLGAADTDRWDTKKCRWTTPGGPLSSLAVFTCLSGFTKAPYGRCVRSNELFPARPPVCEPSFGGIKNPQTGRPIDLVTGAKTLRAEDFDAGSGLLRLSRTYSTAAGGSSETVQQPLSFANWSADFTYELHLGASWSSGRAGLLLPDGSRFIFAKSGLAMVPYVSSQYPIPSTDFSLEFVGTWPATLADVKATQSRWSLRDPQNNVWELETIYNVLTGEWDIARPVRKIEPGGQGLAFTYGVTGNLTSVTDSYGKQITFDWTVAYGMPKAIKRANLPDGTRVEYTYAAIGTVSASQPDRLVAVERRDPSGVLLDRASYSYADTRFPYFVTSVQDRDGVTRWTVTYDDEGRATQSTGPGGVDSTTVAYSVPGASFSRTVTNALGKSATYNFTRTSTNYDVKLVSVVGEPSPNCPASSAGTTYGTDKFVATSTDEEGRVTAYTRDSKGRATQTIEAQGTAQSRTTTVTWHATINQPTEIQTPGLTESVALAAVSAAAPYTPPPFAVSQSFSYTGGAQSFTAPTGVSTVSVELWGAAGGNGNYNAGAWSGAGGFAAATFPVSAGDVVTVEVGGGGQGAMRSGDGGAGGWPDGGAGGKGSNGSGGGGGSTRLYINGALKVVVGGGGGSGGLSTGSKYAGAGGGESGQDAEAGAGSGGSQVAGGVDLTDPTNAAKTGRSIVAFPGVQRTGGWGSNVANNTTSSSDDGGGGGGGYWGGGGGGGDGRAGGGGSTWIDPSALRAQSEGGFGQFPLKQPPGQTSVARGVNSGANGPAIAGGDGYAILGFR